MLKFLNSLAKVYHNPKKHATFGNGCVRADHIFALEASAG